MMPICPSCGTVNRSAARFCYQCATPLALAVQPYPQQAVPVQRPSPEDHAWLAATLTAAPLSPRAALPATETPAPQQQGGLMNPQPPSGGGAAPLFAGRYEIAAERGTEVEVVDRQPWRRCWSCGTTENEAGEQFCTSCGAHLDPRRYHGQLSGAEPSGLALVGTVTDAAARELLPPVWDQVQEGERTLTLAADSGRVAVTPPLEELDALYVGRGLAQLLATLHAQGLALGAIAPGEIELTARQPRLRAVPNLRRADAAGQAEDVPALAALLESLTATPRTTRRLEESEIPDAVQPGAIAELLSAVRTGGITTAQELGKRFEALIAERTQPLPLRTLVGAASHTGMVRDLDEDAYFYTELRFNRKTVSRTWGLYIVADGMGGHAAGEVASDMAIRGAYEVVQRAYFAEAVDADAVDEEDRLREIAKQAALQANEYVLRESRSRNSDMGTTITLALVAGDRAVVANVGDSRTYMYQDGQLRRVSKDHSLVQRLVDLGQIAPDDVYSHPQRNAVLRSLGDKSAVEVDVFSERLKPGDALLLMSDGQWEMTRDPEMEQILESMPDPQAACVELVKAANAAGGDDNITVVLVRFVAEG
jgi:protein phosphatase